jgi:hypothetical protein
VTVGGDAVTTIGGAELGSNGAIDDVSRVEVDVGRVVDEGRRVELGTVETPHRVDPADLDHRKHMHDLSMWLFIHDTDVSR